MKEYTQYKDFYPRSPCGERLSLFCHCWNSFGISIHALLAESDVLTDNVSSGGKIISIHALLAESDDSAQLVNGGAPLFLSTLSLRRATS